ncbi:MAG: outer membrane beta-barrel protein, partial [Taibaiella sp.]|nr:outer membrane beta-barrel protein [Taibaiella sp.]
ELPLNVLVKTGKPGHNRFFIGGGAYFAYNFSGQNEATIDNQYYSAKMKIGYDKRSVVKPFDVGFNFNAGFETKWGVFMRAQVRTGIIDLSPGGQSNINFVNHNGSVTIGYLFGGKAKMKPEVTP